MNRQKRKGRSRRKKRDCEGPEKKLPLRMCASRHGYSCPAGLNENEREKRRLYTMDSMPGDGSNDGRSRRSDNGVIGMKKRSYRGNRRQRLPERRADVKLI
ncbi:hypothetical protein TWF718_001172 [Orbilia javanica]|uniref:Uncharacterized protein n=1 Tax=Orbilia javanica TaxID=47235 RepID=A0AAN8RMI4_9PEZI